MHRRLLTCELEMTIARQACRQSTGPQPKGMAKAQRGLSRRRGMYLRGGSINILAQVSPVALEGAGHRLPGGGCLCIDLVPGVGALLRGLMLGASGCILHLPIPKYVNLWCIAH